MRFLSSVKNVVVGVFLLFEGVQGPLSLCLSWRFLAHSEADGRNDSLYIIIIHVDLILTVLN